MRGGSDDNVDEDVRGAVYDIEEERGGVWVENELKDEKVSE